MGSSSLLSAEDSSFSPRDKLLSVAGGLTTVRRLFGNTGPIFFLHQSIHERSREIMDWIRHFALQGQLVGLEQNQFKGNIKFP